MHVAANINLGSSSLRVGSNTTIIGTTQNITITGCIQVIGVSNVIIQNLNLTNPSRVATGDGIEIHSSTRVFVTKCTFSNCADGSLDIVRASDNVTVSWCRFRYPNQTNHCFTNLIGNSDSNTSDRGKLRVTLHHNWYDQGCRERMPRVRFGQVHLYNNYYASTTSNYNIGVGNESQLLVENNYFENQKVPWKNYSSSNAPGRIQYRNNHMVNSPTPTWATNSTVFSPSYAYSMDAAANVKNLVISGAGNVISSGGSNPSVGVTSGNFYRITPRHSGKAIDVQNCGIENGTNVQQWSWLQNDCQSWRFTDVGNGYWRISPANVTARALRANGSTNGSNVMIQGYSDQTDRQWRLVDMGNGFYQIRLRNSDRCLDIVNFSTADGANAIIWDCNNNSMNQQYSFSVLNVTKSASVLDMEDDMQEELANNENPIAYPNPVTNGIINVNLNAFSESATVTLTDISGRVIFVRNINNQASLQIPVDMKASLYLLTIKNDKKVFTQKISVIR